MIAVIGLLAAGSLTAQGFQLLFLDGDADVQEKGGWVRLSIGDELPPGSLIRLESGAIAEFAGPKDTLLFSSPGTYRLDAVQTPAASKTSAAASIFNRIAKAGSEADQGRSQVMGVRGSEAVEATEFTWVDEDSLNFEEAVAAFNDGDFMAAVDILENEVDPIVLDDESSYWYYLAASYDSLGNMGPALRIVRDHRVESYSPVYGDFLFLDGRLALASRNFRQASDSFGTYALQEADPARRQLAWYLLGVAELELGDSVAAHSALREAVKIDADTEVTGLAKQLLP